MSLCSLFVVIRRPYMKIQAFFDEETYTLTYAVFDPQTKDAVIIDPVMDYEPASSSYFYEE